MGNVRLWLRLVCAGVVLGLGACNGQLQPADEKEDAGDSIDAGGLLDAPKADDPVADAGVDSSRAVDASIEGGLHCGDGLCTALESAQSCPADCGGVCGDDRCSETESACGCAADCGATTCGDGCCGGAESSSSCATDCGAMCGDGTCNGGETPAACPADCATVCGDGACDGDETACGCAADCGVTSCGDGCCGTGEGTATCAGDCGSRCGDGACNGTEATANCVADCGSQCGDGACNGDETPCDCSGDCGGPACGDGYCCAADGENACNCGGDCTNAVCGDGCCTGSETNASCSADCEGGPLGSLMERLGTTSVTAPAGVKGGVSNWRIWGRSGLRIAPVFTVPLSNCQTLVGYTTNEGGTLKPRVARLDANDTLVTTYTLTQDRELRGLAAEPDGHFGALLFSDSTDQIWVNRYDTSGSELWSEELINVGNTPTDFGIGDSRLEFGGSQYGAYYHVHSNDGHEGDTLKFVDTAAGATTRWTWGCSHMMSALLRYNVGDKKFLPVCVTDCYPGTSGDFASQSIGGIYLNHRSTKVMDVAAGCNGRVAGELGSAAPGPSGWKLIFNAHRGNAAKGQSSYDTTRMNQDIGFASIDSGLASTGPVWLTDTADINEADASIARWQPEGDAQEQYLVGWTENNGAVYRLGVVRANGAFNEGPIDVTANVQWGRRDDPMRAHKNGDVVWSWFGAAGDTSFRIARVRSGRTCVP